MRLNKSVNCARRSVPDERFRFGLLSENSVRQAKLDANFHISFVDRGIGAAAPLLFRVLSVFKRCVEKPTRNLEIRSSNLGHCLQCREGGTYIMLGDVVKRGIKGRMKCLVISGAESAGTERLEKPLYELRKAGFHCIPATVSKVHYLGALERRRSLFDVE